MSRALQLTEQLISRNSVTPDDADCQHIIADRLKPLGFECETIVSGPENFRVTNLWAKFKGFSPLAAEAPAQPAIKSIATEALPKTFVFAGHTDVVLPARWNSGTATPSRPAIAMACCTGAARLT